jgi:Protein of unknown function (DUF3370)
MFPFFGPFAIAPSLFTPIPLASIQLAQAPAPQPQEVIRPQEMRVLPGSLDSTLVFNSNSPEQVESEGILLSTFPPDRRKVPEAHLNQSFTGRFEIFTHHIRKGSEQDLRTLYHGVIAHNPTDQPVAIDILQAASYLSQPDAPFIELAAATMNNDRGTVYAGPGSRAASDILRGRRQADFPGTVTIPPGGYQMLLNLPIPVKALTPPVNGRSSIMRVRSTGKVYLASLALLAKTDDQGAERAPTLTEWQDTLQNGALSTPRDKVPTPIGQKGNMIYGRVAGVSQGAHWRAYITDGQGSLRIPETGKAFSYGIATLYRGTLGTAQNQSAKMIARYPDTAYEAHGNYAVQYSLTMPLINQTSQTQTVVLTLETPLKREDTQSGLRFLQPLPRNTFFRGPVRFRYTDDAGIPLTRYFHLVQKRGQQGDHLVIMTMKPGDRRLVKFDVIYPADATPPQVFTVKSL